MIKHAKFLYLLVFFMGCGLSCKANQSTESIVIKSSALKMLDGTKHMNVAQLMIAVSKLKHMRFGEGKKKEGMIEVRGKKYTLTSLVSCEGSSSCGFTAYEIKDSLRNIMRYIQDVIAKHIDVARHEKQVLKVIDAWMQARGKDDSFVYQWMKQEEEHFFEHYLNSYSAFNMLIEDFTQFIKDIRASVPKSNAEFEEMMRKKREARAQKNKSEL